MMFSMSRFYAFLFVTFRLSEAFISVQHRWQSTNQRIDTLNSREIVSSGSSSALCQSASPDSKAITPAASISYGLNPGNTSAFLDFDGRNHRSNHLALIVELMNLSAAVAQSLRNRRYY
jgi:hypothetical protein